MSDIVIQVEKLAKRYTIGGPERAANMRELMAKAIAPWKWFNLAGRQPNETFWALKGVSFEVERGEVVGVIGRNGAGKSTLLKVLSRITEPTAGKVMVKGRMGSLLEVGTGFHPELTGRENIFLNGAILGMSQAEVRSRFDEIVSFAEVETFLDTPVKWYSSGMYLRLAFSVAAHLNPEILVVDEVLAVGDTRFQEKCTTKMSAVANEGRTVLFVSHNMAAIQKLCTKCITLKSGMIYGQGSPEDEIVRYLRDGEQEVTATRSLRNRIRTQGSGGMSMVAMTIQSLAGSTGNGSIVPGGDLAVAVEWEADRPISDVALGVVLKTSLGHTILAGENGITCELGRSEPARCGLIEITFCNLPLLPGWYLMDVYVKDGQAVMDKVEDALRFEVSSVDVFGTGKLPLPSTGPVFTRTKCRMMSTGARRKEGPL